MISRVSIHTLREAHPTEIPLVRELFVEYAGTLDFDLGFQGFAEELASLPGKYAPPSGCILLAFVENQAAGCVAMRPFEGEKCEMKRLYVRPGFRGQGLGEALVDRFTAEARGRGYRSVLLDTVEPLMSRAIAMYKRLGFREIPPYRPNPVRGAMYLELQL
jgi:ribosomal protein S18 acetylase RimI-like enzyme